MDGQTKVAISLFLGAMIIASALYLGLTRYQLSTSEPKVPSPTPSAIPTQIPDSSPQVVNPTPLIFSPSPEIGWTKSDLIIALSIKTGIPEAEIIFSTGETVDNGDIQLIRGTVQRQGEMGGAGFFAVADVNGVIVTYAGQGVPECSQVNPYGYPLSWVDYCMEGGAAVRR